MWFAAPFNGPRRVISPICSGTSPTPGKMRALLPDQLHDHGKQPEVTGGFRVSQWIESGRAKAHVQHREADDDGCRRSLNERGKITERKQEKGARASKALTARAVVPIYPDFLRAPDPSRGAIIPRMTSLFCCVACAASLSLARSSISKLISANRLRSSTASASNFR
jgi:hypothetical protein